MACPASSSSGYGANGMLNRCAASIAALLLAAGVSAASASDSASRLVDGDGVLHERAGSRSQPDVVPGGAGKAALARIGGDVGEVDALRGGYP
jgi:hypothetical protein